MITLASIKSELGSLALRVAAFESQQTKTVVTTIMGTKIELLDGEEYVGIIAGAGRAHDIILLPGELESVNWKDAMSWAQSVGGELPDRCESALLFATMKDRFKDAWYWTREQHAALYGCAWGQGFASGTQGSNHKYDYTRARAVRRLPIE